MSDQVSATPLGPVNGQPHKLLIFYGGAVQAGFPSPAEDFGESSLDLNELLIPRPAASFLVRAKGHSMVEQGIHDGDILIVDRSLPARSGCVVIAALDGEFTVKLLGQRGDQPCLLAANPAYAPIIPAPGTELTVWGVVTAAIHRF